MKRLFLNELSKLNSSGAYIIFGIALLFYLMEYMVIHVDAYNVFSGDQTQLELANYFLTNTTKNFNALLPILIIVQVGNELRGGILKKMLADTYSRKEYFIAKLLMIVPIVLITLVFNYVFYLIYSSIYSGESLLTIIGAYSLEYFLIFLLFTLVVSFLGLVFILLIKRKVLAIILCILYQHVEIIVRGAGDNIEKVAFLSYAQYLPVNTITQPSTQFLQQFDRAGLAVFYIALMAVVSYLLIKRYQVKR